MSACRLYRAVSILVIAVFLAASITPQAVFAEQEIANSGFFLRTVAHFGGWNGPLLIQGSTAYLSSGDEIKIFSLANPDAPVELGSLLLPGLMRRLVASGSFIYTIYARVDRNVSNPDFQLAVINVADPAHPALVGSLSLYQSSALVQDDYSIAAKDGYVYLGLPQDIFITNENDPKNYYLEVVDVSNPSKPVKVNSVEYRYIDGFFTDLLISEKTLAGVKDDGVYYYDISNPAQPRQIGMFYKSFTDPGLAHKRRLVQDAPGHAFLLDPNEAPVGFLINPGGPANARAYPELFGATDMVRSGDYGYFLFPTDCATDWVLTDGCKRSSFVQVNLTGSTTPLQQVSFEGDAFALEVANSRLYLTRGASGGVHIFNLSGSSPLYTTTLALPGSLDGFALAGSRLYTAGYQTGLTIISGIQSDQPELEVTNASSALPQPHSGSLNAAALPSFYPVSAVTGDATHAYLARYYAPLEVYDTADLSNLHLEGTGAATTCPCVLTVHQGSLYLADQYRLYRVNISDPANPQTSLLYEPAQPTGWDPYIKDIDLRGNYLYAGVDGLLIFDISQHAPISWMSSLYIQGLQANDITLEGDFAYISSYAVNIADPAHPVERGFAPWLSPPSYHEGLNTVADRRIYMADKGSIGIYTRDDPYWPRSVGSQSFGDAAKMEVSNGFLYVAARNHGLFILEEVPYSLRGKVTSVHGTPVAGVNIRAVIDPAAGDYDWAKELPTTLLGDTTSGADGTYAFADIPFDSYTLTPSKPGLAFTPTRRSLTLPDWRETPPPNFIALPAPIQAEIGGAGGSLSVDGLDGGSTQVAIPAGAVGQPTTVTLMPTLADHQPTLFFSGQAFTLSAARSGQPLGQFTFSTPLTLTLSYSAADLASISDENAMVLLWKPEQGDWQPAGSACAQQAIPALDTSARTLTMGLCQTGTYALMGPGRQVYLPVVRK